MTKAYTSIRQGLPKRRKFEKSVIMKRILENSLKTNFLGISKPNNAFYGIDEMQMYFHALIAEHGSGNHIKDVVFDKYRFNLPDQQTVRVRCEKLDVNAMEQVVNHNLRELAMSLPTYNSGFKLGKIKGMNTQKRRSRKSIKRKRQRERDVDPPQGRYLAIDFTLQPNYTQKMAEYRLSEHPIAAHLTKDRRKHSTSQFIGYHTAYDVELGSRQVLGIHMLTNIHNPSYKEGWQREPLDLAVRQLVDPILEEIPIAGITCDGDYYNQRVIQYFVVHKLDFVIRGKNNPVISKLINDAKLKSSLADGEGYEYPSDFHIASREGTGTSPLRLIIVKRGQELVPLVLPKYSELTPEQALLVYEERFGIETVYRETYKYLPSTCSTSPNYRLALYAFTVWFFNLLLNYYEIVVIWSPNPTSWHTSLSLIHARFATLLGQIMGICSQ